MNKFLLTGKDFTDRGWNAIPYDKSYDPIADNKPPLAYRYYFSGARYYDLFYRGNGVFDIIHYEYKDTISQDIPFADLKWVTTKYTVPMQNVEQLEATMKALDMNIRGSREKSKQNIFIDLIKMSSEDIDNRIKQLQQLKKEFESLLERDFTNASEELRRLADFALPKPSPRTPYGEGIAMLEHALYQVKNDAKVEFRLMPENEDVKILNIECGDACKSAFIMIMHHKDKPLVVRTSRGPITTTITWTPDEEHGRTASDSKFAEKTMDWPKPGKWTEEKKEKFLNDLNEIDTTKFEVKEKTPPVFDPMAEDQKQRAKRFEVKDWHSPPTMPPFDLRKIVEDKIYEDLPEWLEIFKQMLEAGKEAIKVQSTETNRFHSLPFIGGEVVRTATIKMESKSRKYAIIEYPIDTQLRINLTEAKTAQVRIDTGTIRLE